MIISRISRVIVVAFMALLVTTQVASAQIIPIREIFLPFVNADIPRPPVEIIPVVPPTERPTPYDVPAQAVAIGLGDVPDGFAYDTAQPIEASDALLEIGFVSGYDTLLFNEDELFFDAFGVGSLVYVMREPTGAQLVFEAFTAILQENVEYQQLSITTYGDATSAFVVRDVVESFDLDYFYVLARKGNVVVIATAGGLASVTELSDATFYAHRMVDKLGGGRTASDAAITAPTVTDTPLDSPLAAMQSWTQRVEAQVRAHILQ